MQNTVSMQQTVNNISSIGCLNVTKAKPNRQNMSYRGYIIHINFDKVREETKIVYATISDMELSSPTQLHHPYISYQSDTHRDTPALTDTMLATVRKWSREWGRDNNCQGVTVGIWEMRQLELEYIILYHVTFYPLLVHQS
jgi:hypothetical protein